MNNNVCLSVCPSVFGMGMGEFATVDNGLDSTTHVVGQSVNNNVCVSVRLCVWGGYGGGGGAMDK